MGKRNVQAGSHWFRVGVFAPPAVVCLLALAAYAPTRQAPFVYDDLPNIKLNQAIQISSLTPGNLWHVATDAKLRRRPLANLSFAVNYWWGGLNVPSYHLTNWAIHLLVSLAVYQLALLTLRLADRGGESRPFPVDASQRLTSVVAMAIFALHPLQTQSVTYIVQRMNSLAALFYLTALLCYLAGRLSSTQRRAVVLFALAVFAWGAALASKENAITLPLAVGLYEWLLLRSPRAKAVKPIYVLATLTIAALAAAVGLRVLIASGQLQGYENRDFTLEQRLLTQARVVWRYAGLTVLPLPSRLNLLHEVETSRGLWSPPSTFAALAACAAYLAVSVKVARRWPVVAFGLCWAPVHLLVESSVLPLEMMYEHRMYLPLFGPALAVAWAWRQWGPGRSAVRWLVPTGLALFLAALTHARNQTWQTPLTLWNDVLTKSPNSARAYANRGGVYTASGDWPNANRDLDRALEIEPGLVFARIARGAARHLQGDHRAAADDLWLAVGTARNDEVQALALRNHGAVMTSLGKYPEALDDFTRALKTWPHEVESLFNRGNLHRLQGHYQLALDDYAACVQRRPAHAEAHNNLAALLAGCPDAALRDPARAIAHAQTACRLRDGTNNASFLETLAAAHAAAGDFAEAARWQAKAVAAAAPGEQPALRQRLRQYDAAKPGQRPPSRPQQ